MNYQSHHQSHYQWHHQSHYQWHHQSHRRFQHLARTVHLGLLLLLTLQTPARAQSIIPATDGTGTQVILNGSEFSIQGGSLSGDGRNLFHSFETFNLSAGEIATFLSSPSINTIIGRITGGSASRIDGLVQIRQGNSQLILLNPSGIITGLTGDIDVMGGFTATTADQVNFGEGLLTVQGDALPNYGALNGSPTAFIFGRDRPGSLINQGTITTDGPLQLFGGTVINTGELEGGSDIRLVGLNQPQAVQLGEGGEVTLVPTVFRSGAATNSATAISTAAINVATLLNQLPDQANSLTVDADGTVRLLGASVTEGAIATTGQNFDRATSIQAISQGAFVLPEDQVLRTASGDRDDPITQNASLEIQAASITGGSFNAGNPNSLGQVRPTAGTVSLTASGDISLQQLLGRQVNMTSQQGNISLTVNDNPEATEGSRTVRAQNVVLLAPQGDIQLAGGIQAGEVERPTDGTIRIEAENFRATAPFENTALAGGETGDDLTVSMSLWAYPANVPDGQNLLEAPTPLPQGIAEIRLADGLPQRVGQGNVLISLNLSAADRFEIDPVLSESGGESGGGSGSVGDIGVALSRVPPNVDPLVLNNEFISLDDVLPTNNELAEAAENGTVGNGTVAIACDPVDRDQDPTSLKVATTSLSDATLRGSIEEASPEDFGLVRGISRNEPTTNALNASGETSEVIEQPINTRDNAREALACGNEQAR